jgi:hypothetical protein
VPPSIALPAWLLIVASVYFGLDSSLTLGAANDAARTLMEQAR